MAKGHDGDGGRSVFSDKKEALAVLRELAESSAMPATPPHSTEPGKKRSAVRENVAIPRKHYLKIAKYGVAVLAGLGIGYLMFGVKPECTRSDLEGVQARLDSIRDGFRTCKSDLDRCKNDLDDCGDEEPKAKTRSFVPGRAAGEH